MRKVNWIGIFIGVALISVAFFPAKDALSIPLNDRLFYKYDAIGTAIFLSILGLFFIRKSLKGQSTVEILKTEISNKKEQKSEFSYLWWPWPAKNGPPSLKIAWFAIWSLLAFLFIFVVFSLYRDFTSL